MAQTKVVVVGLLSGQADEIRRKCGASAKLTFIDSGVGHRKQVGGDHCFLVTKFSSHTWANALNAAFPKGRVHYHRGGVKKLADAINAVTGQAS